MLKEDCGIFGNRVRLSPASITLYGELVVAYLSSLESWNPMERQAVTLQRRPLGAPPSQHTNSPAGQLGKNKSSHMLPRV